MKPEINSYSKIQLRRITNPKPKNEIQFGQKCYSATDYSQALTNILCRDKHQLINIFEKDGDQVHNLHI